MVCKEKYLPLCQLYGKIVVFTDVLEGIMENTTPYQHHSLSATLNRQHPGVVSNYISAISQEHPYANGIK